jgi:uncharacterized protein YceK
MGRVFAIGVLLLALTGCGTAQNFTEGYERKTRPYGGARIAAARFNDDPLAIALMSPLWTADLGLSVVGDTLTLPVTVPLSFANAVHDYYFPPDEPGANEWRRFWGDHALPVREKPPAP